MHTCSKCLIIDFFKIVCKDGMGDEGRASNEDSLADLDEIEVDNLEVLVNLNV